MSLPFLASVLTKLVLVFALVSVGFAHTFGRATLSPELAEYVAAGGSLADICGEIDGQGPMMPTDCEACRIVDNLALPHHGSLATLAVLAETRTLAFVSKRLRQSQGLDPARLTRAPPQA
ncbi:hypothetical protein [uncultured Roseobacter sp.]|uniref:hypothetical protein n=1 Tax=uncultured Roseobacter sp. TaxID=114847 RepID=UPI0026282E19|nr:hypothetical protein [uncultured Roseobacter sp.]